MSETHNELQNKKKGLGRGLGSLLGNPEVLGKNTQQDERSKDQARAVTTQVSTPAQTTAQETNSEARIWKISIDKLSPSSLQPRHHFEKEKLKELADSIRENGIFQPILARKIKDGKLEIVAGERRWRAAQIAGLHEVPVIFKVLSNRETLEMAIVENIQREDLNPIEEAEAYNRLMTEFSLTQQQVAEKVGKERATISNSIRLLGLAELAKRFLSEGVLTAGHAKALLAIPDMALQNKLAQRAVSEKLSVRDLERLSAKVKLNTKLDDEKIKITSDYEKALKSVCAELQKALGTKVQIDSKDSKGKISVYFYSEEELNNIVDKLKA